MIDSKRTGLIGKKVLIAKLTSIIAMTAISCCCTYADAQQVYRWGPDPFNNDYNNPINWSPIGVPNSTSHAAVIEKENDIFGNAHDPKLFADATLGGLTLRSGGKLDTKNFELVLNPGSPPGYVGKTNIFDGDLWVRTGGRFDTEDLNINAEGQLHNRGGFIQIDKRGEVLAGGELEGYGTVELAGSQPLVNNGLIRSNGVNLGLTINRTGSGSFDWDGTGDELSSDLVVEPNTTLRVNMPVTDPFSGFLFIREDGVFRVDPAWTLDRYFNLDGGRIEGGPMTVTGEDTLMICRSSSRIDSNVTIEAGNLEIQTGFLQFTGNATFEQNADVEILGNSYVLVDEMFDNNGATFAGNEINVRNGGTFNMTDGSSISLNLLDIDAGASFEMTGGMLDLNILEINTGGSFEMTGGALTAGGVVGDLELSGGQLLTSTVNGSLTLAAGSIEVGETIGFMLVDGDFILQQGATLAIDLFNAVGSASDEILVTGDVDLAGTLNIRLPSSFAPADGQQYPFLTCSGNLSGEFEDLTDGDTVASQDGFDLVVHYHNNRVELVAEEAVILGDVNGDGVVNLLDVGPFIELLSSGDYQEEADVNQDGAVNLLDVDDFIELLAGDQ